MMLRKVIGGLVLAAVPLLAITQAQPASATCNYGGCPNGFASTCYNLKKYKWCSTNDGYSTVHLTNKGSYEGAFDWARNEIASPHNGVGNSIKMPQKSSGGNIKVYDFTGSSSWWGLASNYVTVSGSNKCLATVKVQINKGYMSSSVRKKYTMLHELGHAVGLNHACVCPRTMNPCGTCGDDGSGSTPYLKKCDAKGVRAKYHCRSKHVLCGEKCCAAPSNGKPTCSSGSCGFTCNSGTFKCAGVSCCAAGNKCCPSGACVMGGALCPS